MPDAENTLSNANEQPLENSSEYKPARDPVTGQLLPGNTANPNGRPKGSLSLVKMIKDKLETINPDNQKTYAESVIEKFMELALKKDDTKILTDLVDRIDGKARESIDLKGNIGFEKIEVEITNKHETFEDEPNTENQGNERTSEDTESDRPELQSDFE